MLVAAATSDGMEAQRLEKPSSSKQCGNLMNIDDIINTDNLQFKERHNMVKALTRS